jgi:hypothetical protein
VKSWFAGSQDFYPLHDKTIHNHRNSFAPILLIFLFSVPFYGQTFSAAPARTSDAFGCTACEPVRAQGSVSRTYRWPVAFQKPDSSAGLIYLAQQRPVAQNQNQPTGQNEKTEKKPHAPSATAGSPGHIFWVIPAFKVDYGQGFKPLTPKEKFQEWARTSYDPLGLGVGAFEAGILEYSSKDGFCGYGKVWSDYGKCFGSLELDATDSSFIGDFVLPVVLHQDPRFFRLGEGSFGRRLWWAVSRVFLTYNDSGHTVFYSSALTGTVVAAALSNLYYPSQDVGARHTMTRIAIDLGNTALYNLAAEFWPDIHKFLPF